MADLALGPESLLAYGDGEDAQTLHDRLDLALRYIANWYKATGDSANKSIWWTRIDQVRAKVEAAERAMNPSQVFPGNAELALYNDAGPAFAQLWRDLTLSADTLPDPSLLAKAADTLDTILQTPGYVVSAAADAAAKIAGALGKGAGDAARNFVFSAWPLLAIAGIAGVVYFFRKPLARALSTGAA
ncbi:MAG TPA: hypothetical protein VFJ64_10745 [Solirubrobacterales bacterium]|nr:hypothetical protein [Solirubrobacterales bacterium]